MGSVIGFPIQIAVFLRGLRRMRRCGGDGGGSRTEAEPTEAEAEETEAEAREAEAEAEEAEAQEDEEEEEYVSVGI